MKYFSLFLLAILCYLQLQIWLPERGLHDEYAKTLQEMQISQQQNSALRQRNQLLAAEVNDLNNGFDTTAEIARSEMNFIESGEIFYNLQTQ